MEHYVMLWPHVQNPTSMHTGRQIQLKFSHFSFSSENSLAEVTDSGAYNNVIFIYKIIYSLWPCELQRIL